MFLSMKVHLYGTSLGGFLAGMFAWGRPRCAKSLVLSNSFLETHKFSAAMPRARAVHWAFSTARMGLAINPALRSLSSVTSFPPHIVIVNRSARTTSTSSISQLPEVASFPQHYSNPDRGNIHSGWSQARASHTPSSNLSNSLLASLSSNPSVSPARKVFVEMLQRNIPFDTLGFGLFIAKLCKTEREIGNVLRIVQQIKKRHEAINSSIVAFLIVNALCKSGRKDDAWKALEELKNLDCKPDFIAYRTVSEEFRLAKQFEEESRILKQKRKLSVAPRERDYKEFLHFLIQEGRIKEAKEVAEAIVDGNFSIDESLLYTLIGSVSDVDTESGVMFCKYMVQKGKGEPPYYKESQHPL